MRDTKTRTQDASFLVQPGSQCLGCRYKVSIYDSRAVPTNRDLVCKLCEEWDDEDWDEWGTSKLCPTCGYVLRHEEFCYKPDRGGMHAECSWCAIGYCKPDAPTPDTNKHLKYPYLGPKHA